MHPWHDVEVDEGRVEDVVPAVIEIPKGSKTKYELDKASGLLRLDRVLHGAVHYPADHVRTARLTASPLRQLRRNGRTAAAARKSARATAQHVGPVGVSAS